MASVIDYKGIPVLDITPSGQGGLIVESALKILADRIGPTYKSTSSPTANHDGNDTAGIGIKFEVNSRWYKTSGGTEEEFICLGNATAGAIWKSTTAGTGGGGGDVTGKADKVSGATAGHLASLDSSGNLADSGFTSASFATSSHIHDDRYFTEAEITTLLGGKVDTTRTISTTSPLAGGGPLSSNLTLSITPASGGSAGSMSAAHYTMLVNATQNNTPSTLVWRDIDGDIDIRDLVSRNIVATSITDNISNQKVRVSRLGTLVGTRKQINFIEGTSITMTVADDSANDRVNVTISSAGGGAGGVPVFVDGYSLGYSVYYGKDPSSNTHYLNNLYSFTTNIKMAYDGTNHAIVMDVDESKLSLTRIGGILPVDRGGTGTAFSSTASGPVKLVSGHFQITPILSSDIDDFDEAARIATFGSILSSDGTIQITPDTYPPNTLELSVIPDSTIQMVNIRLNGSLADTTSTLRFIDDPSGTVKTAVDGSNNVYWDLEDNVSNQRIHVSEDAAHVGTRPRINFIAGSSISLDVVDDPFSDEVQVTINATGSASGESNTASNLGTGTGVYASKSGVDLRFKSIKANSGNITVSGTSTEVQLDVPDNTSTQKVQVSKAGTLISTRHNINLIEGASITLTVADDVANDRTNITVAATGSATGEVNTASNVGSAGIGVFNTKSGVDLRFKKLNALSTKISIADDAVNTKIDFDVVEANLTHNNIGGILGLAKGGTAANLSATGGTGQYLKQVTSGGSITVGVISAADLPTGIDAAKIAGGAVSNTEFSYLDGVTSAIQTQLNGKANTSHTQTASTITDLAEAVQDIAGAFLSDSATIDFTYNDAGDAIAVDVKANSSTQKVEVAKGGALTGTRKRLNFIEGSNVTLTVADDSANDKVDITINSTGGGGGGTITGANNVNVSGTGVFKQLNGSTLEFRGIVSTSNRLGVALDSPTNEIRLTINENNFNLNNTSTILDIEHGGSGADLHGFGGAHSFVRKGIGSSPMYVDVIGVGDVPDNISIQKIQASINYVDRGARKRINFIEGGNATIIVDDDPTNDQINVTIAGIGGGGTDTFSASTNNAGLTLVLRDEDGSFEAQDITLNDLYAQNLRVLNSIVSSSGGSSAPLNIQNVTYSGAGDVIRITPSITYKAIPLAIRATYNQGSPTANDDTVDFLIDRTEISMQEGDHRFIDCRYEGVSRFGVDTGGFVTAAGLTGDISTQKVEIWKAGALIGTRKRINFIEGTNVSITTANDSANNRVNVTVNAVGSVKKYSALVGNGSNTVFTITQAVHGQAADQTNMVQLNDVSTGEVILAPIVKASNGDVSVTIDPAPTSSGVRILIMG